MYCESFRKASINRDVSLCVSLALSRGNTSSRPSVALQALRHRVQVDHLQLRQVTAAAARLLANHHLEGRRAPVSSWKQLAGQPHAHAIEVWSKSPFPNLTRSPVVGFVRPVCQLVLLSFFYRYKNTYYDSGNLKSKSFPHTSELQPSMHRYSSVLLTQQ